jgi:hypothetical protein
MTAGNPIHGSDHAWEVRSGSGWSPPVRSPRSGRTPPTRISPQGTPRRGLGAIAARYGLSAANARARSSLANAIEGDELNLTELQRQPRTAAWEIGLRRAVGLLDGETEPPTADAAVRRAAGQHPYRSYAAGHLWRSPAR